MAESSIKLPDDGGNLGKLVHTRTEVTGEGTVHNHVFELTGIPPLPSGAATEATLAALNAKVPASPAQDRPTAAAPEAVRLSDGTAFYKGTTPSDTQPVSAISLPLPTGAATEATLQNVATEATLQSVESSISDIESTVATLATQATLEQFRAMFDDGTAIASLSAGTATASAHEGVDSLPLEGDQVDAKTMFKYYSLFVHLNNSPPFPTWSVVLQILLGGQWYGLIAVTNTDDAEVVFVPDITRFPGGAIPAPSFRIVINSLSNTLSITATGYASQ